MVSDSEVQCLASKATLRELYIGNKNQASTITDRALLSFQPSRTPHLHTLTLQYSQVGDKGLTYLLPLTQLKALDIRNTLVTQDGLETLEPLRKHCVILS